MAKFVHHSAQYRVCLYIYIYMCVCVCVCERERAITELLLSTVLVTRNCSEVKEGADDIFHIPQDRCIRNPQDNSR